MLPPFSPFAAYHSSPIPLPHPPTHCRWLDPAAAKSLATHQLPFGTGQRTCLGMNLAYAEMVAVLAELGRSYTLSAQCDTDWSDFPIKRPGNGLPIRLQGRSRGQNGGVAAAGAGANATVATGV